ncbi:MAG: hypothetical protein HRU08_09745 [Oleispira sp.]|nr:hypothetical protein [Oleispira sp.]
MILLSATRYRLLFLLISVSVSFIAENIQAECRDFDAISAANQKAASFFKKAEVFHPAVIQKIHHPTRKKEVASYIKTGSKRYSIFTLVDHNCKVEFRKRTRQGD